MESIHFRNGTKKDIGVLAELFRETVCRINSRDYSPEQIAAWTGGATPKRWDGLFSERSGLFLPNGIRMERYSVLQQSIGGIYIRCSCMRNTKAGASDRDCWSRRKHMRICRVPFGSLPK